MNELQKIIKRFELSEEESQKLYGVSEDICDKAWYLSRATAFSNVLEVLKDFESSHLMLVRPAKKTEESMDEGMAELAKDAEIPIQERT